jgi:hypothetical protein
MTIMFIASAPLHDLGNVVCMALPSSLFPFCPLGGVGGGGGKRSCWSGPKKERGALIKICLMVVVIKCESYRTGLKI